MERCDTTLLVALISTVTFVAGFTIPGGLKSDGKAVLDGSFMAVQDNKGKGSPTETRMKREGKICLQDRKI
ncbi:unnamed protein product [Prunus armeniaca]|uniref:PGG domain-containing protein n=1 Tax=Prunus armeniaca TaxID=36596 RepID=A0A6J5X549_PRUAR|nr:unnamed protein product [Prunus armeniaca]